MPISGSGVEPTDVSRHMNMNSLRLNQALVLIVIQKFEIARSRKITKVFQVNIAFK